MLMDKFVLEHVSKTKTYNLSKDKVMCDIYMQICLMCDEYVQIINRVQCTVKPESLLFER